MPHINRADLPPEIKKQRIVSLQQAAELAGVSVDTLKRQYGDLIKRLSQRRLGMRLSDVLTIGEPEQAA